jgi:hypothetical protein
MSSYSPVIDAIRKHDAVIANMVNSFGKLRFRANKANVHLIEPHTILECLNKALKSGVLSGPGEGAVRDARLAIAEALTGKDPSSDG